MSISRRNPEGYPDPTAYQALTFVEREEHAKRRHAKRRKRKDTQPGAKSEPARLITPYNKRTEVPL